MKELIQITDAWGQKAFPIDWSMLPEEVIDKIRPYDMYNIKCYGETGFSEKTVVYFRKVKKFRKGITQVETDKLIFGI